MDKNRIIAKMNEGNDTIYTWKTIPMSLKKFWNEWFKNEKI